MSETRPRRATIKVGLTALAAGAAIAGVATVVTLPSNADSGLQVPLALGYNGAGNEIRQTGPAGQQNVATPLSGTASPGGTATSSTSPTSSSASSSSSTPPSSSSASSTPASEPPPPPPPPPSTPKPPATTPGSPDPAKAAQVVDLVNRQRRRAGCDPLGADDRLTASAQAHSTDMANQNYFSHTSKDGRTFDQRIKTAGYPSPAAENIAKGQRTAEEVMNSWMESDGHRRNILNCDYNKIGVAVDTRGFYWTQNFGF